MAGQAVRAGTARADPRHSRRRATPQIARRAGTSRGAAPDLGGRSQAGEAPRRAGSARRSSRGDRLDRRSTGGQGRCGKPAPAGRPVTPPTTAVARAAPAGYVHEAIAACRDSGRTPVVISWNSAEVVGAWLSRYGLADQFRHVFAAGSYSPGDAQPYGHLIEKAIHALQAAPRSEEHTS